MQRLFGALLAVGALAATATARADTWGNINVVVEIKTNDPDYQAPNELKCTAYETTYYDGEDSVTWASTTPVYSSPGIIAHYIVRYEGTMQGLTIQHDDYGNPVNHYYDVELWEWKWVGNNNQYMWVSIGLDDNVAPTNNYPNPDVEVKFEFDVR